MDYINIILIIILLTLLLIQIHKQWVVYVNSINVKSKIDGKYYLVRNTINRQESADMLALIGIRISKLLNHLKDEKSNKNVDLLLKRYNRDSLMENVELDNTTYTTNKGQEIAVCLATRDQGNEKVYDINKLMFVIIHELSHIGCESQGHNAEFRVFFIYLLRKAMDIKIYNYEDYSKQPVEYCSITINSTPV